MNAAFYFKKERKNERMNEQEKRIRNVLSFLEEYE